MVEQYFEVIDEKDLSERTLTPVSANGKEICLLKLGARIYAFSNVCTHIGGRISTGKVSQDKVMCPEHKAIYRVEDGSSLSFPRRGLAIYPVKVERGKVKVSSVSHEKWRTKLPGYKPGEWET